jgi:hypothetical protein
MRMAKVKHDYIPVSLKVLVGMLSDICRYTERHIEFDLSSLPRPSISTTYLNRLSRHLKFEDSLQYVALPKLRVEQAPKTSSPRSAVVPAAGETDKALIQEKPDRVGLTDCKIVFNWLAKNGVKKIIRVIVLDDGDVAHSDEAIEECLTPFKVEVWDWKKPDICSETIFQAAPGVRVVHLYCTGNNTVLRSWSGGEGLAKLKKVGGSAGLVRLNLVYNYLTLVIH